MLSFSRRDDRSLVVRSDPHKPLRDDVRLLGELLGDTLRALEGEALFARVEEVRALAKRAHAGDAAAFEELADRLAELPIGRGGADRAGVRALPRRWPTSPSSITASAGAATTRATPARRPQPGSCADAFARWRAAGLSDEALADAVRSLRIELVLTAHPTEIVRRTLLQTHRRIADVLAVRDRPI